MSAHRPEVRQASQPKLLGRRTRTRYFMTRPAWRSKTDCSRRFLLLASNFATSDELIKQTVEANLNLLTGNLWLLLNLFFCSVSFATRMTWQPSLLFSFICTMCRCKSKSSFRDLSAHPPRRREKRDLFIPTTVEDKPMESLIVEKEGNVRHRELSAKRSASTCVYHGSMIDFQMMTRSGCAIYIRKAD